MSAHSVNAFLEAPSACLSQQWRDKICSQTSNASNSSLDTVQRTPRNRRLTPTSVRSLGSVSSNPLRVRSENTPPACISSRNVFHSADDASLFQSPIRPSKHSSHKSSWSNDIPLPRSRTASALVRETGPLEDVDLNSRQGTPGDDDDSEKENEEPQEPRLSFETTREEVLSVREHVGLSNGVPSKILTASSANPHPSRSFKRWISHLRPHALKHRKPQTLTTTSKRWPIDDSPSEQNLQNPENPMTRHSGHRKTNSRSSAGIVDAVKAVTMARTTSTPASRKSRRSNLFGRSSRSSKVSEDQARVSSDQSQKHTSPADDAALRRIVRRQQTLEELVNSEASYVADLKVLIHAYFTLLASAPNGSQRASTQIHNNVMEILRLHEDLLRQIQRAVRGLRPRTNSVGRELPNQPKQQHRRSTEGHRIASAVAGLVHAARTSIDGARPTQTESCAAPADLSSMLAVIEIFERMLSRFFIYEEYGAQYELMVRDMASTSKSISHWQAFERSIEALANSLATSSGSDEISKKGLAFEDLLIKPIQRICKYPLLFEDLYSNTLEVDDPSARAELSKLLGRLREIAAEINKATNDPETQAKIQRSWRLQDLLILPPVSTSPASLRLIGYPMLCGVLYVAWESEDEVCGEYMLCVLFKSHLLLAIQQTHVERYDVVALITLSDSQLEKADDGRGLQCHTASFSWKLIFEASQHLYELIFCACSPQEEQAWTTAIIQGARGVSHTQRDEFPTEARIFTTLTLDAKPLGPVFGMFGSVTRRLSIQRAATVHSRTNGAQVIIRNTTATKENMDDSDSVFGSIGRSKSVMTASRVPILAPKRIERTRMESSLADVWSRDRLPFPGMGTHRGDYALRTSASAMMRKISRASISSTFSKRSASTTSFVESKPGASLPDLQKIGEGDERDPRNDAYQSLRSTPCFSNVDEQKVEGSGKLVRTGTVRGVKLCDATNQIKEREPRVSAQTVRIESTEKGSPRIVRKRRSVPPGLLKGLSADAVKAWRN